MANIIEKYNSGEVFPTNYSQSYIATKHIQDYSLRFEEDIINKLEHKLTSTKLLLNNPRDFCVEVIVGLLKGNIILQGPPGTGKTTIAAIISKVFNVSSEVITATTDWTTYDTIGGYQPSIENGAEIFKGRDGKIVSQILKCCNKIVKKEHPSDASLQESEQAHWMVIDELNRCEIDKAFGDLFTAFGGSSQGDRRISLPFHEDINKHELYIPNRFRIIGIMNNVDKNFVFNLSQALTRRFTFITIDPPSVERFDEEVNNILDNLLNDKINIMLSGRAPEVYSVQNLEDVLNDPHFRKVESQARTFLKRVRYVIDQQGLGLAIGTAQIIDVYEAVLVELLLSKYLEVDESNKEKVSLSSFDRAISTLIVPQMDGYYYEKLQGFAQYVENGELKSFTRSLDSIKRLL